MPRYETFADVLEELGGIDPRRVRVSPAPGKATEKDLLRLLDHGNRLYELVDGTLVEGGGCLSVQIDPPPPSSHLQAAYHISGRRAAASG